MYKLTNHFGFSAFFIRGYECLMFSDCRCCLITAFVGDNKLILILSYLIPYSFRLKKINAVKHLTLLMK